MEEFHHILKAGSIDELLMAQERFLASVPGTAVAFKRYFLSDAASQRSLLPEENGAVSYIQQPPLDGSAIAVWLYLVKGAEVSRRSGETAIKCNGTEIIFTAGMTSAGSGSELQTKAILQSYGKLLQDRELSVADNCVRTWFFCRDIDERYAGLVKGRKEFFDTIGLTTDTHYLASTGITGVSPVPGAFVQMDACAVKGDFSQKYLYGASHLNPTWEYGVTFERGVRVDYDGTSHALISGTASIDNNGRVLHVGDVVAQTGRMLENVEVLLHEAGSGWPEVRMMLVYLRNASDYASVVPIFASRFPGIPCIIVHAPVCRPDWLIEMECIAICEQNCCHNKHVALRQCLEGCGDLRQGLADGGGCKG